MATLQISSNQAGKRHALVAQSDGRYAVYAECLNYNGRVIGGVSKSWRYVEKNLTEGDARALFARRIAGKKR